MDISTPALLFPAISLLLLAYTNRFLGLASIIRGLHASWKASADPVYVLEIRNLRKRMRLIKGMQIVGILALLVCTASMFLLHEGWTEAGRMGFAASLVLMATSLALSLAEILLSGGALDLHLRDMEGRTSG